MSVASGTEFYAVEEPFSVAVEGAAGWQHTAFLYQAYLLSISIKPIAECGQKNEASESLLTVFFLGFLGGFSSLAYTLRIPDGTCNGFLFHQTIALTAKPASAMVLLYGFFIFLIYVCISIPFHIIGNVNAQIFNTIATNAWLNILFFIVFIVFAISFFGYFEITLPGSIANKADERSSVGSVGGIFFMALTLTIVSFSCTGIILGSLLVGEVSNGAWPLTMGLAGFGVALGLPFAIICHFPISARFFTQIGRLA